MNKKEKKEITWNIVNSLLAGGLVFTGALTTGHITLESVCASLFAAGIVAITQFKNYWAKEKKEYCSKAFSFIKI